MELIDFLRQTQSEVRSEYNDRLGQAGPSFPFQDSVFAEIVMDHMAEIGMTFDPQPCHFQTRMGNANLRLSGFSISNDADQIDLFVSLYKGTDEIETVPDAETRTAVEQCLRFLVGCANGRILRTIDESNDAYHLALNIHEHYPSLDQIRIYVLTDRVAKSKQFKSREEHGKTVKLEVMDIERLHRHWSEGKPRDELVIDFQNISGGPLPCVWIPGDKNCDYALTVFPGEALRFLYDKFGPRLLEQNVRSFLGTPSKSVNAGIRKTIREDPERFIAFNNGIVITADEATLQRTEDGGIGIAGLKGMQIVNGGQTTASIYFTKKKDPETDLGRIRVPAKIIVFKGMEPTEEEGLVSDISKFANSQKAVKLSDLSANNRYHIEIEKLANSIYCPDGIGRWFYERAAGSYNVLLMREGTTPARLKKIKEVIPSSRRITKTDLAKYIQAWNQKPEIVSLGSQNNFEKFMASIQDLDGDPASQIPDPAEFKRIISKAIIFKKAWPIVRPEVGAFAANVTAYLVSLIANRLGDIFSLELVWQQQDLSPTLRLQIKKWAAEVNAVLHASAGAKMISEWAKKPECWDAVREATYSQVPPGIPELGRPPGTR